MQNNRFDKFTERSRRVLIFVQEEATRFNLKQGWQIIQREGKGDEKSESVGRMMDQGGGSGGT